MICVDGHAARRHGRGERPARVLILAAAMLIELANRQLALARSEGSAMKLFGFAVDASSIGPWALAIVLLAGGVATSWRLCPKVDDAWGSVNAGLWARGRA